MYDVKQPISVTLPTPDSLAQLGSAVQDLMREGEAQNTRMSYAAALNYWDAWHALRFGSVIALPVPASTVLQFLVDHVQRHTENGLVHDLPPAVDEALVRMRVKRKLGPMALNTVMHRIAVLSKAHSLHNRPNPCQTPEVREVLSRTRSAYAKRGSAPARKAALVREPLEALLATCDDSLKGKRDRALLLFAWASGGRRRSEVTKATLENTRRVAPLTWVYSLGHSKSNQTGTDRADNDKPIVGVAAEALEVWLAAGGIKSGPIFRRIRKGTTPAEPLAPSAVRLIVKERCKLAGLEGDFSAHSLRSGFVTEAGRQRIPLGDTMTMTGHSSVATVMKYFRTGDALTSPAARLLDGKPTDPSLSNA